MEIVNIFIKQVNLTFLLNNKTMCPEIQHSTGTQSRTCVIVLLVAISKYGHKWVKALYHLPAFKNISSPFHRRLCLHHSDIVDLEEISITSVIESHLKCH